MAWSNTQKQIGVRACRQAGIADEHRKLLLRQFANSLYDHEGRATNEPSSTSAWLNQSDFEQFMATIEHHTGGQVLDFSRGYWAGKAADDLQRMRHLARNIAIKLEGEHLLHPDGQGLRGWIRDRISGGRTEELSELDYQGLHALINSLRGYARRHGIKLRV